MQTFTNFLKQILFLNSFNCRFLFNLIFIFEIFTLNPVKGQIFTNFQYHSNNPDAIKLKKIVLDSNYTEVTIQYSNIASNSDLYVKLFGDFSLIDIQAQKEYKLKQKYKIKEEIFYSLLAEESTYFTVYFEPMIKPSNNLAIIQNPTLTDLFEDENNLIKFDNINIYERLPISDKELFLDASKLVILPIFDTKTSLSFSPLLAGFFSDNPIYVNNKYIYPVLGVFNLNDHICIAGEVSIESNYYRFYFSKNGEILDSLILAFKISKIDNFWNVHEVFNNLHNKLTQLYSNYSAESKIKIKRNYLYNKIPNLSVFNSASNYTAKVKDNNLKIGSINDPYFSGKDITIHLVYFLPGLNALSVILPDITLRSKLYFIHQNLDSKQFIVDKNICANRYLEVKGQTKCQTHFNTMPLIFNTTEVLLDYLSAIFVGFGYNTDYKKIKQDLWFSNFDLTLFKYFDNLEQLILPFYNQAKVPYSYVAAGFKFKLLQQPHHALSCFYNAIVTSFKARMSLYESSFIKATGFKEFGNYFESQNLNFLSELYYLAYITNLRFSQTDIAINSLKEFYNFISQYATNILKAENLIDEYRTSSRSLESDGFLYDIGRFSSSGLASLGYTIAGIYNDKKEKNLKQEFNNELEKLNSTNTFSKKSLSNPNKFNQLFVTNEIFNYFLLEDNETNDFILEYLLNYANNKPFLKKLVLNIDLKKPNTVKAAYNQMKLIESKIEYYELSGKPIPAEELSKF